MNGETMRRGLARLPGLWRAATAERLHHGSGASLAHLSEVLVPELAASGRQGGDAGAASASTPFMRSRPLQWRGFASKAEEYNVIEVETGLVVIEG